MAILNIKLPTNLTEYPNSFKRQGSFPLEAYSVFYSIQNEDGSVTSALNAAKDYAKNNPISYVGQILAVVDVDAEGTSSVKVYKIENSNGDLLPVGNSEAADAAIAELTRQLGEIETAYQNRCAAIEADVTALEEADAAFEEALANIYNKTEIDAKVKELSDGLANVYTKDEMNTKISDLSDAIADEVTRATNAETALGQRIDGMYTNEQIDEAIKAEADRAKEAEGELSDDLANLILTVAGKASAEDVYSKSEVYTKTEVHTYVASEIGSAGHLKRSIVEALPEGEEINVDTIYMVPKEGVEGQDVYVEYMYIDHDWEIIGDTTVDLTPYAKSADVNDSLTVLENRATAYTDSEIAKVNAVVETKVDNSTYTTDITNINNTLNEKVDNSTYTTAITTINQTLEQKVDNTTLENVVNEINTSITNINNVINGAEGQEGESLISRVGALENGKADKAETLAGYGITDAYTKGETYTRDEIAELIADITGGESAADVLAALNAYKGTNDDAVAALQNADLSLGNRITALENVGAQANVLEAINFNGQDIAIVDKKATFSYTYDLPVAMAETLGGVKSSDAENKISVSASGEMEVNSLNVNKLTQTNGDTLILNGGSANV